jgi:hypothetical protein
MESNVGTMRTRLGQHPVLTGTVLGFTWGVVMRLWMRYISTNPEFTWAGTGYIIGSATLVGALLGVAVYRRNLGRGNWWRLNGLAVLLLGMAAGGIMMPTVLVGGLALGRRRWPTWLRATLLVLAFGAQVVFFAGASGDFPRGRFATGMAAYAVMLGLETWAGSIPFLPSRTAVPAAGTPTPLAADAPS